MSADQFPLALPLPNLARHRLGLTFPPAMDKAAWVSVGNVLLKAHHGVKWYVGDWLAHAHTQWGEEWLKAQMESELTPPELAECLWVSREIPLTDRKPELSWKQHRDVVASFDDPEERRKWLDRAARNRLGESALRREIRSAQAQPQEALPMAHEPETGGKVIGFVPMRWRQDFMRWSSHENFREWPAENKAALRKELEPLVQHLSGLLRQL